MALKLSSYTKGLEYEAKARYLEKVALINGIDPFAKSNVGKTFNGVPPAEDCDLVSDLVHSMAQFKARKGLEVYNQFVYG